MGDDLLKGICAVFFAHNTGEYTYALLFSEKLRKIPSPNFKKQVFLLVCLLNLFLIPDPQHALFQVFIHRIITQPYTPESCLKIQTVDSIQYFTIFGYLYPS